jgi:hypothetical protein
MISTNVTFQGLYSYYKKTKTEKPDLFAQYKYSAKNDELNKINDSTIVLITGLELNKLLKTVKNAVVYMWSPNCKSRFCPSLDILQRKCNEKQIELFVVAETFDINMLEQKHKTVKTLYGINTQYYKTNFTAWYRPRFIKDMQEAAEKDKTFNRLFYFKNGLFIKSVHEIENLQ